MSEEPAGLHWSDHLVLFHASRPVSDLRVALFTTRVAYVVLIHAGQYYAFRVSDLRERFINRPGDRSVAEVLSLDKAQPARWLHFGPSGTPIEVGDDSPVTDTRDTRVTRGGPVGIIAPSAALEAPPDEHTDVLRRPSIQSSRSGADVTLVVDLVRTANESQAVHILGLSENWGEIPVHVQILSTALTFAGTGDQGVIYVRRNADSVPCTLHAQASGEGPLDAVAMFSYEGRHAGFAPIVVGGPASPRGTVVIEEHASAPDLTVKIIHFKSSPEGCFVWSLEPRRRFDSLPSRLSGEIDLGVRPGEYTASLFDRLRELVPGQHMAALQGIGEGLWAKAPEVFRKTYWAMRDQVGERFSIQFISDDPYIPWELMRPLRDNEAAPLLAAQHPVARMIGDYESVMKNNLPRGRIVTVAPKYADGSLPAAQDEAENLENRFQATRLPGTRVDMLQLLEDKLDGTPVGLLHFAGHGQFGISSADRSRILLEDGSLFVDEVDRHEVHLGEHHRTMVLLNACEVGATGVVLGTVAGWAEAFSRRKFGGLVAPLWPVVDEDASTVIAELVDMLWQKRMPVGTALTAIRAKYGEDSPTFFSYVFYGDVLATVAEA